MKSFFQSAKATLQWNHEKRKSDKSLSGKLDKMVKRQNNPAATSYSSPIHATMQADTLNRSPQNGQAEPARDASASETFSSIFSVSVESASSSLQTPTRSSRSSAISSASTTTTVSSTSTSPSASKTLLKTSQPRVQRARKRKRPVPNNTSKELIGYHPSNTMGTEKHEQIQKQLRGVHTSKMIKRSKAGKRILGKAAGLSSKLSHDSREADSSARSPSFDTAHASNFGKTRRMGRAFGTKSLISNTGSSLQVLYGFAEPKRVKTMYSIIRSASGALGGAAAGGAIYGEVTMTSFHRLLYYLQSLEGNCKLHQNSSFLDVGSGLGKPNLHVAAQLGCVSVGVEMIGARWWRSLAILRAVISRVKACPPPLFIHANITDCNLNHFTHIYAFDRGFPPETLKILFARFQESMTTRVLICYQHPKKAIRLGLTVPAAKRFTMKMSGSGEQHSCWVYLKADSPNNIYTVDCFSLLRSWPLPAIPAGMTELDSPVPHCESYANGIEIASAAIENICGKKGLGSSCHQNSDGFAVSEKERTRAAYLEWVIQQQGLDRGRRSRRQRIQRKFNT